MTQGATGLYIHIPFCRQVCPYCDFNVVGRVPNAERWQSFFTALQNEITTRAPRWGHRQFVSIYFGGGTPSLATPDDIGALIAHARTHLSIAQDAEISLEVDPGTANSHKLKAYKAVGVNRISLGWQSTHDQILAQLGRAHDAQQSMAAFESAVKAGFQNISIDLIFAVPGQQMPHLSADLKVITDLQPQHVALYALTFHRRTRFTRWRDRGKIIAVSEEHELKMMQHIKESLCQNGFEHYEVSNYAQPNQRSRHNMLYWTYADTLGVGPGAHSFYKQGWEQGIRWETIRSVNQYLRHFREPKEQAGHPQEGDKGVGWVEFLRPEQLFSESMLCGTRLADGVSIESLANIPKSLRERLDRGVVAATQQGWLKTHNGRIQPTPQGLYMADSVAQLFF